MSGARRAVGRFERPLFDDRVPRAAVAAAPEPSAMRAAFLTDENGFRSFHAVGVGRAGRVRLVGNSCPTGRPGLLALVVDPCRSYCNAAQDLVGDRTNCAAISRTSIRSPPCDPMMTTSSPGDTSSPLTSAISMSMHTDRQSRAAAADQHEAPPRVADRDRPHIPPARGNRRRPLRVELTP